MTENNFLNIFDNEEIYDRIKFYQEQLEKMGYFYIKYAELNDVEKTREILFDRTIMREELLTWEEYRQSKADNEAEQILDNSFNNK